jgi:hypothetical protein
MAPAGPLGEKKLRRATVPHSISGKLGGGDGDGELMGMFGPVNQLSSVRAMIKRPSKYGELSSTNRGFYYHVSYRSFNSYLTVLTTNIWVLGVNISHALLITY